MMMQSTRYKALLRSLFASVMQSELSASDLRLLAEELRRGRLGDELAYMVEEAASHFQDPIRETSSDLRALERLVKDKRLTKAAIQNIITSIDARSTAQEAATMRQILQEFLLSSSQRQLEKFKDIIASSGNTDPYLKGISERDK
ncbi:hypothetical protein FHS55_003940 [Angulomicrobium tetraedrale]|uniref:Uncharacterized protein n=1 Tax=Ancylobacter tetraedralis TaxID=217068 RepID=A0A839ZF86_9HYPH|nr:hypothetical protein [Ancylobacter tetraedralis]MBB3773307.1 hypothetical protein [Ancylobacter tetraedralis]